MEVITSLPMTSAFLVRARADELRAHRQRIEEARARRGKVETPGFGGADAVLDQASGGGKEHIRRHGGDDDEVDVVGPPCRVCSEQFWAAAVPSAKWPPPGPTVPLADPGSLADPLVGGLDQFSRSVLVSTRGGT